MWTSTHHQTAHDSLHTCHLVTVTSEKLAWIKLQNICSEWPQEEFLGHCWSHYPTVAPDPEVNSSQISCVISNAEDDGCLYDSASCYVSVAMPTSYSVLKCGKQTPVSSLLWIMRAHQDVLATNPLKTELFDLFPSRDKLFPMFSRTTSQSKVCHDSGVSFVIILVSVSSRYCDS